MILGNYQVGRRSPVGEQRGRNEAGLAFLQKRGCGGQGCRAGKKGSSEANQDQGTGNSASESGSVSKKPPGTV